MNPIDIRDSFKQETSYGWEYIEVNENSVKNLAGRLKTNVSSVGMALGVFIDQLDNSHEHTVKRVTPTTEGYLIWFTREQVIVI